MSNYPPQSPWGPHGPQVDAPSTTPNPTIPTPMQGPGSMGWGSESTTQPSAPRYSGGGTGGSSTVGSPGQASAVVPDLPVGPWVRNLALGGAALGALFAYARGSSAHVPSNLMGGLVLRFAFAGAAAGAGIPAAIKAFALALRAVGWVVLAGVLWWIASYLVGGAGWLARLR